MEVLQLAINFILHIDQHLIDITAAYGVWTYAVLALIVFAETGLVVTPFLPGDSLLFAAGAICALGTMNVWVMIALLIVAAILGDGVNYTIGNRLGPKIFSSSTSKLLNREHLNRTHAFYERHGGKTIILARFMPIIRTFAPFVAGIGSMRYRDFAVYNVVGAIVWVASFSLLGYYFGNLDVVRKNFTLVIGAIIVLSVLPALWEVVRARKSV